MYIYRLRQYVRSVVIPPHIANQSSADQWLSCVKYTWMNVYISESTSAFMYYESIVCLQWVQEIVFYTLHELSQTPISYYLSLLVFGVLSTIVFTIGVLQNLKSCSCL